MTTNMPLRISYPNLLPDFRKLAIAGIKLDYASYVMAGMQDQEIKLLYLANLARNHDAGCIRKRDTRVLKLDNNRIRFKELVSACELPHFPYEIWIMVLGFCDIKALTAARAVSRTIRNTIDNMPSYRLVFQHAPYLIRASLMSGLGGLISIKQLHQAFMSTRCNAKNCQLDAEYIFLLGPERLCAQHLQEVKIQALRRTVEPYFKQGPRSMHHIARMRAPTDYGSRYLIVEQQSLRRVKGIPAWFREQKKDVEAIGGNLHCVLKCSFKTPWFDTATRDITCGYHCDSDPNHSPNVLDQHEHVPRPAYTRTNMLAHLDTCTQARAKWARFTGKGEKESD